MKQENLQFLAPCLFGLESILAFEIKRIGGQNVAADDGRVAFSGDLALLARANQELRCAERVCIVLGEFRAASFTELFDGVEALPLEEYIGEADAFPVKGWSLKSQLHSIPDCQKIIKKAASKRLGRAYGREWLPETGPIHQLQFSILKDKATLMLDTSGEGLHKRGYRADAVEAPIKETLAAGIADLARVGPNDRVIDPMCGSGTFLIESALRATNTAPGLFRRFSAEQWADIPADIWRAARERVVGAIRRDVPFRAQGYDLDPQAVMLTQANAKKAGVNRSVSAAIAALEQFEPDGEKAIVLCNPPYGERMLELRQAEELYRLLGRKLAGRREIASYIISPHEDFEKLFGRRADKRRKLYNGMIRCQLFMFFN